MEMEKRKEIPIRLFKAGCRGICLDPEEMKLQGSGGDGTVRTFVIRTACQCCSGEYIKKNEICWYVA